MILPRQDTLTYLGLSLALSWLVFQLATSPVVEPAAPFFPSTGHNIDEPMDVDGDGTVSAVDTTLLFESLRDLKDSLPLPVQEVCTPHPFLDVDGDGYLTEHDARFALIEVEFIPALAPAIGPQSPSEMQANAVAARK